MLVDAPSFNWLEKGTENEQDLREAIIWELRTESSNKLLPNFMHLIIRLILISLSHTRISAHRANIHHPIPILNKSTPFDRDIQISNVVQHELHKLLVAVLANILDEGVGGEWTTELVGGQAVLGEAEIEEGGDWDGGRAELLLLLGQVGAADKTDGDVVAELGEEGKGLWCDGLGWGVSLRSLQC